jgi:hypothetical protein
MRFYKYHQLSLLAALSLCTFIMLCTTNSAAKKIRVATNTKIIFEKYDTEYFRLKRYLQTVDNLTSMLLGSRQNIKLLLRIIVVDKKKMKQDINIVQAGKSINIYINGDLEQWRHKTKVNKLIISTLLFTKCDIKPSKATLPDWLLTGLNAELKYKTGKKIFSPATYLPGVMALVRAGKIPNLSTIIAHPIKTEDGTAYKLYEEFSRFLLRISEELCNNDNEAFSEIVILSATENYNQQEIFSSTIGRVAVQRYNKNKTTVNDDKIVNQWFQQMLISKAANYFFPRSARDIDHKFNQLFPVKCEVKIGDEKYKTVSLTLLQLPAYFNKIKAPFTVKSTLATQIGQLTQQAPFAISNPLHIIRKYVSNLGSNSPQTEQQAFKRALINYHKALAHQIAIEDYLDNIEQREQQLARYNNQQIEVIGEMSNNPWAAMQQYLDKVEKKYLR